MTKTLRFMWTWPGLILGSVVLVTLATQVRI